MGYCTNPGSHPPSNPACSSKFSFMSPLFFLLLFSQILLCAAVDTINSTTPLSGTQKIVSPGNKFALGFYSPPQSNTASSGSGNYYIAIWYSNIPIQTTVWTATTDMPVSEPTTTSLEIATDGNLVLFDQAENRRLWSTNVSMGSNSTMAIMRDSGSLDLTDASNSSIIYWRSIDHPTNTWLPGGKLMLNKTTGVSQRLVSWKNNADPSPGLFSLELDPNGTSQYFIQWNESITYWTSGTWNGVYFSSVPEMASPYIYDFQFVNNAAESYFIYSMTMKDDSILSRSVIHVNGQIRQLSWVDSSQQWILFWSQPRMQCDVYALCGAYGSCNINALSFCNCIKGYSQKVQSDWDLQDYSGGCKRNVPLQCQPNSNSGQTKPDKFYTMAGVRLPDNAQSAAGTSSRECEVACLNNCSCNAYTYDSSGCFVWHGVLVNLQEEYSGNGVGTLFLRLAASELPDPDPKKSKTAIIGGVAAVLIILAIVMFFLFQKRRRDRALRISKTAGGTLIAFRRNGDHGEDAFFPTLVASTLSKKKLAASKLHEGDVQTLLDPRLKGDANPDELTRACSEQS
ncbi:hypothetical protein ACQ4PT_013908 [Festuca glaucescens]